MVSLFDVSTICGTLWHSYTLLSWNRLLNYKEQFTVRTEVPHTQTQRGAYTTYDQSPMVLTVWYINRCPTVLRNKILVLVQDVVIHYHSTIAIPNSIFRTYCTHHQQTIAATSWSPSPLNTLNGILAYRHALYRWNSLDVCSVDCMGPKVLRFYLLTQQ